jgi:hypothetical protein
MFQTTNPLWFVVQNQIYSRTRTFRSDLIGGLIIIGRFVHDFFDDWPSKIGLNMVGTSNKSVPEMAIDTAKWQKWSILNFGKGALSCELTSNGVGNVGNWDTGTWVLVKYLQPSHCKCRSFLVEKDLTFLMSNHGSYLIYGSQNPIFRRFPCLFFPTFFLAFHPHTTHVCYPSSPSSIT